MADQGAGNQAEQSRIQLNYPITFITLAGERLPTLMKRMNLTVLAENSQCSLVLEVEWSVYQELLAGEWMGLLATARTSEVSFEDDQVVELRVVLRQSLMKIALQHGSEAENVLQTLLKDTEETHPLRMSESWLVLEAKQQLALPEEFAGSTLKQGYRTLWAASTANRSSVNEIVPSLNEVVEQYLSGAEIPCERMNDAILSLNYTGEQGTWTVLIRTDEEAQVCLVYSIYPVSIPEEQQAAMAVFLTDENYDLVVGNFELDREDGELRYRTSLDVENARLTTALFGRLFTTNVEIMDHYFHTISEKMGLLEEDLG